MGKCLFAVSGGGRCKLSAQQTEHQKGEGVHDSIINPTPLLLPDKAADIQQNAPQPIRENDTPAPVHVDVYIAERDEVQVVQDKEVMSVQLDIHSMRV